MFELKKYSCRKLLLFVSTKKRIKTQKIQETFVGFLFKEFFLKFCILEKKSQSCTLEKKVSFGPVKKVNFGPLKKSQFWIPRKKKQFYTLKRNQTVLYPWKKKLNLYP